MVLILGQRSKADNFIAINLKNQAYGTRYVSILTGDIVWINGPYPCGVWPDISIFRDALITELLPGERVEADDGYIGEHPGTVKCPKGAANKVSTLAMQQRARNRQETVNKRFKNWGCLKQVWRHAIPLHGQAFTVITIITQLAINEGERLFECNQYSDPVGI